MKNPKEKLVGYRFGLHILNAKLGSLVVTLLLIQLFVLTFANTPLLPSLDSPSRALAQSNNGSPIDITEFDGGILIEWALPSEVLSELSSDEPFNPFIEAGWKTDLLDHVVLPAYTIALWESPLEEDEIAVSSEEILALVDVLASRPITLSIGAKTMPTQTLPSGDELPFISPLAPPDALAPTNPVYILREGMQRGERQFVIAVSPIYLDGEQIKVATRGSATLMGIFMNPNQSRANQVDGDSVDRDERELPEETADTAAAQTKNEEDTGNHTTSPLSSPLASPTNLPQSMPLSSPLTTPTVPVLVEAKDGNITNFSDSTEQQAETLSPLEEPIDEAAQTTPSSDEPLHQSSPPQRPITPWTGLLTFAFFGLALIYILSSGPN